MRVTILREKGDLGPPEAQANLQVADAYSDRGSLRQARSAAPTSAVRHDRGPAPKLGMSRTTLAMAATKGRISARTVVRVAKIAGVPVSDILTGAWPEPRVCPMCG